VRLRVSALNNRKAQGVGFTDKLLTTEYEIVTP
jgi:hypothetical protein